MSTPNERPSVGDIVRRIDQPEITATVTGLKMKCVIVQLPSGKKRYWDDGTYEPIAVREPHIGDIRVSTSFWSELTAVAEGLDQHDHVKIRTAYGFIYFAIGVEPPVGDDANYDEVVP